MMRRAGRVHVLRGLGLAVLIALVSWGGMEAYGHLRSAALVESLRTASTAEVPPLIRQISGYRRWADPRLIHLLEETRDSSREHLHASLALLPGDATQVDALYDRLITAAPVDLPILRDALGPYRSELAPKLWSELEKTEPDNPRLLPSAGALALYDAEGPRWADLGGKVAEALVKVNPVFLGQWLDALRPVRFKLTVPLAAIFRDKARPETEHALATNILADYAKDAPDLLAGLLMAADPKAFRTLFPVAERQAEKTLPVLRAELGKTAMFDWNDQPLDPSWTNPDAALAGRIEAAGGLVAERFAFCQAMPLDEFRRPSRPCGHRATGRSAFRPYADGPAVRVAAVWTRDGRKWRIALGAHGRGGPQAGRDEPGRAVPPGRCRRVLDDRRRQARRPLRGALVRSVRRRRPARNRGDRGGADRSPEAPRGLQADPAHAARSARFRRPAAVFRSLGQDSVGRRHEPERP